MKHNTYDYFAFISYKREDAEWAKSIQNKIESFKIPAVLRKDNPSLPNKIRPVFRDESDLSGGNLKKSIEKGLENSKYLIVICSPQAAKSPWVSREVQYFIDHGREDYIIPFIIDGSPNAKNEQDECFPIGLRQLSGEKEILGININEMGREAAVIKTIARMFDIRFDSLWQRHERAKRRKHIVWGVTSIVIIVIMGVVVHIINKERNKAIEQEKIAIEQRDKAERAQKDADAQRIIAQEEREKLKIAKDSIVKQSTMIAKVNHNLSKSNIRLAEQSKMIAKANQDLSESNKRLAEERDNVLKANWNMMENRARLIAEKANQLIDDGDVYTAISLCMEVLPKNLDNPEIPYLSEVERTFRRAVDLNFSGKIYGHGSKGSKYSCVRPGYGEVLTYGFDNSLQIWDANTGLEIKTMSDNEKFNNFLISHDGKYLVALNYKRIFIWDLESSTEPLVINVPKDLRGEAVSDMFFKSNNKDLIMVTEKHSKRLVTLNVEDGSVNNSSPVNIDNYKIIAYNPNEKCMASSLEKKVILWDCDYNEIKEWEMHGEITDLKFSPDGSYLAMQSYYELRIVDLMNLEHEIIGEFDYATHFCFDYDNNLFIGGNDLKYWDIEKNEIYTYPYRIMNHISGINYLDDILTFYDNSGVVSVIKGLRGGVLNEWKTSFSNLVAFVDKRDYIAYAHISENGNKFAFITTQKYLKDNEKYTRKIWIGDIQSGTVVKLQDVPNLYNFILSPDGSMIAYEESNIISVIDTKNGDVINTFPCQSLGELSFSYDNEYIAKGSDVMSIQSGEVEISLGEAKGKVVFSPDGRYCMTWEMYPFQKKIINKLWDLKNKKCLDAKIPPYFSFTPDSEYIVVEGVDNNSIEIRKITTGQTELIIPLFYYANVKDIHSVKFNEDGSLILIQHGGTLSIWNRKTGDLIYRTDQTRLHGDVVLKDSSILCMTDCNEPHKIDFLNLHDLIKMVKEKYNRTLTQYEKYKYGLE